MAVHQAPVGVVTPTADIVGNAFVQQYYLILHQSPEHVHRFYHDVSKLGRPEANGMMGNTSTMKAINEKILLLDYGKFRAEISTVDAQESYNGGVIVLVTGYLTGKDNVRRKFTQSFFLAPQDKGYFVLNDIFRYVEEPQLSDVKPASVDDAESPTAVDQDTTQDQDNDIKDQIAVPLEEVEQEEVSHEEVDNPSKNSDVSVVEEGVPVPEVIDETPGDQEMSADLDAKYDDLPKRSYASIVKVMKEGYFQVPAPTPTPVKSAPKAQERQLTASPPPAPAVENQISNSKEAENGNGEETEAAEGYSIHMRGLPISISYPILESEFSKFGPIKPRGIQIRSNKGFIFGFVEFEEQNAALSAVEASPITIMGRQVIVEPKKSTARAYPRDRYPSARTNGFRNDGVRGRGNYGGNRGYNRGETNSRPDFANRTSGRGGYTQRGEVGYQRVDRVDRAPRGFNSGDPAKNMAPRVPASA